MTQQNQHCLYHVGMPPYTAQLLSAVVTPNKKPRLCGAFYSQTQESVGLQQVVAISTCGQLDAPDNDKRVIGIHQYFLGIRQH